jgi:integrase
MATIRFYLKSPKAKKSLLYLYFLVGNDQFKISTGKRIFPSDWDKDSQRPKRTHSGYAELKSFLTNLEANTENCLTRLESTGEPFSLTELKKEISFKVFNKPKAQASSFLDFIVDYIESCKPLKSIATIKAYKNAYNHLTNFKKHSSCRVASETIDLKFYDEFTKFLMHKKHLRPNSIGNQIKNLKVFLNAAIEAGLPVNNSFRNRKFKRLSTETESIYLNESEIQKMFSYDFTNNKRLERTRDLFIIGCYTGLRFSDFSILTKDNIGEDMIAIRTIKTDQPVIVPIHSLVRKVLERYEVNNKLELPKSISNQKMNQYLKEIGEKVGIDEIVVITERKGFEAIKISYKKYELISTHTARRSFATNLYLRGFPSISIMKITGHASEKVFLKYIKISQEENALKLKSFWELNISIN